MRAEANEPIRCVERANERVPHDAAAQRHHEGKATPVQQAQLPAELPLTGGERAERVRPGCIAREGTGEVSAYMAQVPAPRAAASRRTHTLALEPAHRRPLPQPTPRRSQEGGVDVFHTALRKCGA